MTNPFRHASSFPNVVFWVALSSMVSILFSIAISQILLGVGIVLILSRPETLDFPPVKLPLALLLVYTILADLLSGNAAAGLPQIRKFFVFGVILLVYSAVRTAAQIRFLLVGWTGVAMLSACTGLWHVFRRHQEALHLNWNRYDYYLDDRTKGFASHWMTFGAEQMIVLLILISFLLFACPRTWLPAGWCCAGILWVSLMLGLTRSIFLLGVPTGVVYLLCVFQPRTLVVVPVLAIGSYLVMPVQVRERIRSVVSPHAGLDSNAQRAITRRTGWAMVKAHPWFGLGPEQIRPQFETYVPADVPRPLPRGWYGHLHNVYLQYAAERGIPGLLRLLWLIGKMVADFVRALRARTRSPECCYVIHAAIAVTFGVMAEGVFEYNLGDSEVLTMFLAVTSAAYAAIRVANTGTILDHPRGTCDFALQYSRMP